MLVLRIALEMNDDLSAISEMLQKLGNMIQSDTRQLHEKANCIGQLENTNSFDYDIVQVSDNTAVSVLLEVD